MAGKGPGKSLHESMMIFIQTISKTPNEIYMSKAIELFLKREEITLQKAKDIIHVYVHNDIKPSNRVKNILLFGIARNRDIVEMKEWINFMSSYSYMVDGLTDSIRYNALAVASRDQLTNTLRISDALDRRDDIEVQTYTSLLRSVIQLPGLYQQFLEKYEKRLPGKHGLEIVQIQYLFLQGMVPEALKLVDDLVRKDIPVSTHMANVILQGLFENSKVDEAIRFFNKFSRYGITPDAFTFGILIHQMTSRKLFQAAMGFYNHAELLQIPKTVKLESIILNMYASMDNIEPCEKLFEELKEAKMVNTYIFCIMMRFYANRKDFDRVLEVFKEMKSFGLPDTLLARRYCIVACANIPALKDRIMETYQVTYESALQQYQESRTPDTELRGLYLRLFGAFSDDPAMCFRFYEDMKSLGLDETDAMNYIIIAYDRRYNYSEVYRWGKELLKSKGMFINSSYREFLLSLIKREQFDTAIKLIEKCRPNGQLPPIRFQNVLLNHYIDEPKIFNHLLDMFKHDWNTERFRILIEFSARTAQPDKAWQLWKEYLDYLLYQTKDRPNIAVLRATWNACGHVDHYANGLERTIRQHGFDKSKIAAIRHE